MRLFHHVCFPGMFEDRLEFQGCCPECGQWTVRVNCSPCLLPTRPHPAVVAVATILRNIFFCCFCQVQSTALLFNSPGNTWSHFQTGFPNSVEIPRSCWQAKQVLFVTQRDLVSYLLQEQLSFLIFFRRPQHHFLAFPFVWGDSYQEWWCSLYNISKEKFFLKKKIYKYWAIFSQHASPSLDGKI